MKKFGLIGFPISHSFSKKYFTDKFVKLGITDYSYELFPLENVSDFYELIQNNPELIGLNVTIPHKETVIPFLDSCDELSTKVGAVNTIKIFRDSTNKIISTKGFNTDIIGFEKSIVSISDLKTKKALILGTGGASKAVAYVLSKLSIPFLIVSREKNKADLVYKEINQSILNEYTFIINTTPLGKFPEINECVDFPFDYLNTNHFLYDLIYNPEITLFLSKGKMKGSMIKNGFEMLLEQADASFKIWEKEN